VLPYVVGVLLIVVCAQRVRRFSGGAALALIAMPLVFTGRALVTGAVYGPIDLSYTADPLASIARNVGIRSVKNPAISDVYTQFMPWRDALRRSAAHGEWPLWNPYELSGEPLAGAAQSSPYHTFTLLALLVPVRQSYAVAASLMFFGAAMFAFLFFRDLVRSEAAALFGAFAWMASTHLVFFAGTALALAGSAMPLALLGARRVAREPSRRSAAILTTGLALVVLAGHPESMLHIVAFAIAWFAFEMWNSGSIGNRRAYIAGTAAGIAALLLTAVFLLPLVEAIGQTEEYNSRSRVVRPYEPTGPQIAHEIVANLFPFIEGSPGVEEHRHTRRLAHLAIPSAYAGTLTFALALFALSASRSRERWFFFGAVIVGLAAAVNATPIAALLAHLPGFSIAVNDRMVAFAALGFCALAAIGIDALTDRSDSRLVTALAAVAIVSALLAFTARGGLMGSYVRVNAARAVLPAALAACAVAVVPRRYAIAMLIALLALQRAGENLRLQPTLPPAAFYPPFPGLSILRSESPFRIVATGPMLPPEIATHYGLEDVRGFQAMTFARYADTYPLWCRREGTWSNHVDRLDLPMLSLLNVRYAIFDPGVPLPSWWQLRANFGTYAIAENTRVLARAFVPRSVVAVGSAGESLRAIGRIDDFGALSVVENGGR